MTFADLMVEINHGAIAVPGKVGDGWGTVPNLVLTGW